jgi:ribonuclease J
MTTLEFHGGVGEIGGTKVLLEDGEHRILLDFGLSYARRKLFYEEYLQPRVGAGLLDFLEMGIIPPLEGVYRLDLELPGLWERFREAQGYHRIESLDGVLLSHPHADHVGHVSFLRPEIPVHATELAVAVCRANQESGKPGLEQEIASVVPRTRREPRGWSQEALLSERGRRVERRFVAAGAGREAGFPLEVRCFPVDHSIRGACAWAVSTSSGWVVHSGDLRLHGTRGDDTRRFVEAACGPGRCCWRGPMPGRRGASPRPRSRSAHTRPCGTPWGSWWRISRHGTRTGWPASCASPGPRAGSSLSSRRTRTSWRPSTASIPRRRTPRPIRTC